MRNQLAFCVLMILFVAFNKKIHVSAQVQVQFITYENPKHRLSNGRCCEEGIERDCVKKPNGRCFNCTMECDPQFKIYLKQNGKFIHNVSTETLIYKDNFNFTDFTSNFLNPFTVNVSSYRGLFELLVSSYDDDEHLGIDLIDTASLEFNTTTVQPNVESFHTLNGKVTATKVSIKILCDPNTYGKFCDKFCETRDDAFGHFKCDPVTGDIICLPGWISRKSNCSVPDGSYIHPSSLPVSFTMLQSTSMSRELSVSTYSLVIPTQIKDSFTAYTTLMPTKTLSVTVEQSKATNSLSKETKTVTDGSSKSVSIEPTKSTFALMTSINKCTGIETIEFDITLQAELSPNQINETLLEIICMEVNRVCYNIDEQCIRSKSAGRISLSELRIKGDYIANETSATVAVKIRSANGTCTSNFATCSEKSILQSKRLKTILGVDVVTVCTKYGGCTSQIIKTENTNNSAVTAYATLMPTKTLSVTVEQSKATNSLSKETKTVTGGSSKSVPIEPTKSTFALMTSINKCTGIETIEFDITLKAELSPNQINETLLEIICMEVNRVCYNIDDQCERGKSTGRISLSELRIKGDYIANETSATVALKIHSANGTCTSNFATCSENSILQSKRLKTILGVDVVTVCTKYGGCTSQIIKTETTNNPTDEIDWWLWMIVAIVCAVIVSLLIYIGFLYSRKKQMMKVQDVTDSEKHMIKNEEVASYTTQC